MHKQFDQLRAGAVNLRTGWRHLGTLFWSSRPPPVNPDDDEHVNLEFDEQVNLGDDEHVNSDDDEHVNA